ncbi:helix-turn-helix domain-containing protein [Paracoccus jiaweipingae]|uniref:helix-turn-helix domain-containing protein n=1 Tax=unclassified Paracoccus (in: a-proteobacteria) TaxID=2688777 RepID=UPI0037B549C6
MHIFDTLSAAPHARLDHRLDLGGGTMLAQWTNSNADVHYENPSTHTLSLYLQGGHTVRRLGPQARQGRPGTICLMPQGGPSDWTIGTERDFSFVHLYLPHDSLLAHLCDELDRAPAGLELPELTFEDDLGLSRLMAGLTGAGLAGDLLRSQEIAAEIRSTILTDPRLGAARAPRLRGGLGPGRARRIRDFIEAHLDDSLTLDVLAQQAGLSPWHFQRMFRVSFGLPPHGWVERRRIARAETLLRAGTPVAQVASACGFCHQSHLTRAFARARGITPARFARLCRDAGTASPARR